MLDLYSYLEIGDKEDNLLHMVHLKYKFLLLQKDLERRIILEKGCLTKEEKEEQFYEIESLYDESIELLIRYRDKEVARHRKELLEDE